MAEAAAGFLESFLWAIFQTSFHGSRYSGRRKLAALIIAAAGLTGNIWWADRYAIYSAYTVLVDFLILFVYSISCLRGRWQWKAASILLFYLGFFACNFFCMALFVRCFDIPLEALIQPGNTPWRLLYISAAKILLILMCTAMLWFRKCADNQNKGGMLVLFLPVIATVMVSLLAEIFIDYYQQGGNVWLAVFSIFAALAMLLICLYLLYGTLREKTQTIENQVLLEKIHIQEHSYSRLHEYLIRCRKTQHDVKHKLVVAEQLIRRGDALAGQQYLQEYLAEMDGVSGFAAEDTAWETVVSMKKARAETSGIEFKTNIQCRQVSPINEMDFCVLLGNLADNAMEASEKLKTDKCVKIYVKEAFGMIFVRVGNRVEEAVLQGNPQLKSTKADGELHGFGMRRVKEIVKKYGGKIEITDQGGWFWVTIRFYLHE